MLKKILKPFLFNKFLFYQLIQREIKARYKQSFIGYAWIIFSPLSQMLVYTFVFSIVFRFPTQNIAYPIFFLSGFLAWTFTRNSIFSATNSLILNKSLLKQIAFPREVIPYSVVAAKIIDLCFSFLIFAIFMFIFKIPFHVSFLILIPLFIVQLLLTTGMSLLLAAFNLFYRDVQYLSNLLLSLWMYLSPVAYSADMVPEQYQQFYQLNPMVGIIESYRSIIFEHNIYQSLKFLFYPLVISLLLFVISFTVFKKLEKYFADVV